MFTSFIGNINDIFWILSGLILTLILVYQISWMDEKKILSIQDIIVLIRSFNNESIFIKVYFILLMIVTLRIGIGLGPMTLVFNIIFLIAFFIRKESKL